MSYTVYSDNNLVYSPDLVSLGYSLSSAVLTTSLNKAGSFKFSMQENNPMYSRINKLKSKITVYDGADELFRGRVLNDDVGLRKRKDVYAEGELSFLRDGIVRPYEFTGDVADLFRKYISEYNAQVEEDKRFTVGTVNVTDPNNYIVRASSDYPNTWDEINDKLISLMGGFIRTRVDGGQRYIDYVSSYSRISDQVIRFGENLLDINKYITAENVFTVLIPLGAADTETNKRLTIESVNDDNDYIVNETAARLFGYIWHTETWDDVTQAGNLLTKGRALLNSSIEMSVTLIVSAVDLHLLNVNTDRLRVGDMVQVVSEPHDVNNYFLCTKIELDLFKPENSVYTFGYSTSTLTEQTINGVGIAAIRRSMTSLQKNIVTLLDSSPSIRCPSGNLWGDLNGDGMWDNADMVLADRYIVGLEEIDDIDVQAGDLDGDGVLSNADLITMRKLIVQRPEGQVLCRQLLKDGQGNIEAVFTFVHV